MVYYAYDNTTYELTHHGVKGQRWGIRRYQNPDGTLKESARKRAAKMRNADVKRVASLRKKADKQKNSDKANKLRAAAAKIEKVAKKMKDTDYLKDNRELTRRAVRNGVTYVSSLLLQGPGALGGAYIGSLFGPAGTVAGAIAGQTAGFVTGTALGTAAAKKQAKEYGRPHDSAGTVAGKTVANYFGSLPVAVVANTGIDYYNVRKERYGIV